jgi:hypothetical protein
LGSNPSAINLIEKYTDKCSNAGLSANPNPSAIPLYFKHKDTKGKDIWSGTMFDSRFLENENCMDLFIKYLEIDPILLYSKNEEDIKYLKYKISKKKFSWFCLSRNTHPFAMQIIKLFPEKIHHYIVTNPSPYAVDLITEFMQNFDFENSVSGNYLLMDTIHLLCGNKNPKVLELLHNYNPEYYRWDLLSENPSAIPFLLNSNIGYKSNVRIEYLLKNPNIFQYNYENIKENISSFKEELIQRVWCPANVLKWLEQGYEDFLEN